MTSAHRLFLVIIGLSAAGLMLGFLLLNYPPDEYFYVPCIFHVTTGLHCPGCGSTRAIASFMKGDIAMGLKNNLLILLWGPYLLYRGIQSLRSWIDGEPKRIWEPPKKYIIVFLLLTGLYTLLRNLPIDALRDLLSPAIQ